MKKVAIIRDGKRIEVECVNLQAIRGDDGKTQNGLMIVRGEGFKAGDLVEVQRAVESDGKFAGKLTALRLYADGPPKPPFDGSIKVDSWAS